MASCMSQMRLVRKCGYLNGVIPRLKLSTDSKHIRIFGRLQRSGGGLKRYLHSAQRSVRCLHVYHRRCLQHADSTTLLPCVAIAGHRHNSTIPAEPFSATLTDLAYIPPPPSLPIPDQVDISACLNALGEPTLSSLGLCNWTPPGLVQGCLQILHVNLDIPWWAAIVTGVVCLRLLIFPIVIISQRNMVKMANIMPELTLLNEKFTQAQRTNNLMEAARLAREIQDYNHKHDVRPLRNFLMPMIQAPIFISVFFGIRRMAELPVESMKEGGLFWFTDLTLADPFYILPFLSMATMSLIIEIGADGMKSGAMTQNMKWIFRAMPIIIFPFIAKFPAAMLCYWCSSNAISLVQTSFLKIPAVRAYFKIPVAIVHDVSMKGPKKGFVEGFKDTMHNSRVIAEIQNRERVDAVKFKEAGMGPIKRTYRHDPTQPRPHAPRPGSTSQRDR